MDIQLRILTLKLAMRFSFVRLAMLVGFTVFGIWLAGQMSKREPKYNQHSTKLSPHSSLIFFKNQNWWLDPERTSQIINGAWFSAPSPSTAHRLIVKNTNNIQLNFRIIPPISNPQNCGKLSPRLRQDTGVHSVLTGNVPSETPATTENHSLLCLWLCDIIWHVSL